MKQIWFLSVLLIAVKSETGVRMSVVDPIVSTNPCKDSNDITVRFEVGLQPEENNRYYVYVNKTFPQDSQVEIKFDSQVKITFATRTDKNEYSRTHLSDGDTFSIRFFMPYEALSFIVSGTESEDTPHLLGFAINGIQYCSDPIVGFVDQYAANPPVACGRRMSDDLTLTLLPTRPGDWPWHAVIYKLDNNVIKYFCGGTLISNKFVLTAAHCASRRGEKLPIGILSISDIIIHEEYHYRRLRNDIALLKLKTEATFSNFIQPACLWLNNDYKKMPSGEINGTIVVGWEFNNYDTFTEMPDEAEMSIVSEHTCLKSNPLFFSNVLTDYNFCARYHNDTSTCNGKSGSAFQVFVPGERQIGYRKSTGAWHVKGILSSALARYDASICDPEQHVIFTDVEKYMDWINEKLND